MGGKSLLVEFDISEFEEKSPMKRAWRLLPFIIITVMCLCSCGKTVESSNEASSVEISNYEEVSFSIKICTPDAVTYTVCSTKERFLFYEGHQFAYVEKYIDDSWYPLVEQSRDSTGDFKGSSIPTEGKTETISINTLYGGKLENGTYRLVAPCYISEEDLYNLKNPVYIAAEFEID